MKENQAKIHHGYFKKLGICLIISFASACGFQTQQSYLENRANYQMDCKSLQVSDRQSYNNQNLGSVRQAYYVDLAKSKQGVVHRVNHSFLDNNNYMNRIAFNKNMRKRSCADAYFRDVKLLSETESSEKNTK